MRLIQLDVSNYKSLRGIRFSPDDLSVIVGANAAGKSNFSDAIDFLSEVYRHGLDVAVARKGGFENIAFRRMRRSKGAIRFRIEIVLTPEEVRRYLGPREKAKRMLYTHEFSLGVTSSSIRAEYEVQGESLTISESDGEGWARLLDITREPSGKLTFVETPALRAQRENVSASRQSLWTHWLDLAEELSSRAAHRTLPSSDLFVTTVGRYTFGLQAFLSAVSGIRVFQISPTRSREFGVPIPRAELEVSGANLPAVVDLLKRQHRVQWSRILDTMRGVLPGLSDILVDYTSSRTLGLYFAEEGVGRPWSVSEVSDGTVQTLALLVALFDERFTALVLEEPENSVHPWIIRNILSAVREASKTKQVIITTHSPVVMDAVSPRHLFVMWRSGGESHLNAATLLKPGFMTAWQAGAISAFDFIDSGALPQAVPPSPEL
jgi:predicted ATPase